jgi:hypothetical protein
MSTAMMMIMMNMGSARGYPSIWGFCLNTRITTSGLKELEASHHETS